MKKYLPMLGAVVVTLVACHSDKTEHASNDTLDSTAIVKEHQPKLDSVAFDLTASTLSCTRDKTVKDYEKEVNIFGGKMKVKLDNASFSANTDIQVKDGYWYTSDGILDRGSMRLDMTSVSTVKVGKDQQLEMGNPDYLDARKYPYAFIRIINIKKNDDSATAVKQPYLVKASLTLKDSTTEVTATHIKCDSLDRTTGIPAKISFDFMINGIKWGLNKKDVKVTKDELTFHVTIATKKIGK